MERVLNSTRNARVISLMVSTSVLITKKSALLNSQNLDRQRKSHRLVVLLRELKVVVALLELEEQNDLMITDELKTRNAEVARKTTGPSSWHRGERACLGHKTRKRHDAYSTTLDVGLRFWPCFNAQCLAFSYSVTS